MGVATSVVLQAFKFPCNLGLQIVHILSVVSSVGGTTAAADSDGVEGESQPPAEGGGGAARARLVRSTARVRSVSMSDDPDEHDDAEEEVVVQRVK